MNKPDDPLLTITISIDRDGNVYDDTQTHGNSFADVYRGFVAVRGEIDRQIAERRKCPFNPKYGKGIQDD
jgi:hypothetical protein